MQTRTVKLTSLSQVPSTKNQNTKNVLVLSDRDMLFDVIKINLEKISATVVRFEETPNGNGSYVNNIDQFDLIVVASGSSTSEPVVTLFNASLTKQIGQIPMLIISDRQFNPNTAGRIFHLDFPFNAGDLRVRVKQLLNISSSKEQ